MEVIESQQPTNRTKVEPLTIAPDHAIHSAPAESIGVATIESNGNMSPPPKPNRGHTRPLSFAARNGNRLSLSFPIQLPDRERGSSSRQTPTSSTSVSSQHSPAKDAAPIASPKDSAGFMVALAAQERRVLELKEELNRAEIDLKKLKRQWAVHEGSKKRAELKNVEPLRSVYMTSSATTVPSRDELEDSASARRSSEIDRRKALLANVTKDSRRKIITGGHTRTLSLLSPARSSYDGFPSPASVLNSDNDGEHTINDKASSPVIPDITQGPTKVKSNQIRHSYHDSATNGVKQIAEDIKAGLWTFMEDLRQATVGDEALQSPAAQPQLDMLPASSLGNKSSKSGLVGSNRPYTKSVSKSREVRPETGQTPNESSLKTQLKTPKPSVTTSIPSELDDDDWANWDSPISKGASPRWSNSTTISSQSTGTGSSNAASPSTDAKVGRKAVAAVSTPKREEIPWPALNNLTPGNLKRTASAIMKEWEKSLTPPLEDQGEPMSVTVKKLENDQETRLLLSNLP